MEAASAVTVIAYSPTSWPATRDTLYTGATPLAGTPSTVAVSSGSVDASLSYTFVLSSAFTVTAFAVIVKVAGTTVTV